MQPTAESIALAQRVLDDTARNIINAVVRERIAQIHKWGLQRHPTLDPIIAALHLTPQRHFEEFELPTAERAKYLCDYADSQVQITWTHIAVEELSEAVEAAVLHGEHSTELRTELVQLAAVVFAWIESIDAGTPC